MSLALKHSLSLWPLRLQHHKYLIKKKWTYISNMDKEEIYTFQEQPTSIGPLKIRAPMGMGTWAWGDSSVWGYQGYDPSFNNETIEEAFNQAVNCGIDFWDTAEVYGRGRSETILGEFVSKNKDKNLIVATKFIPLPWRLLQSTLRSALLRSLKRLQMDSVDLYQVHGPAMSLRAIEVWAEAMAGLVKEGLVKAIGVSNYSGDQVRRTYTVLSKHGIPLASNQVEFSLLRMNPDTTGMLKTCKELGVTVIAYSPLGMGRLTGKYTKENPPQGNRKFASWTMEEIEPLIEKLKEIGAAHGKTPAQVAINWVICKGAIPIVGVKNKKQVDDNIRALGWRLTEEEVEQLSKLGKQNGSNWWQYDSFG